MTLEVNGGGRLSRRRNLWRTPEIVRATPTRPPSVFWGFRRNSRRRKSIGCARSPVPALTPLVYRQAVLRKTKPVGGKIYAVVQALASDGLRRMLGALKKQRISEELHTPPTRKLRRSMIQTLLDTRSGSGSLIPA